jgi:hypothetical protein
MTAQVPETLVYNGETLSMCEEPFYQYLTLIGEDESPFEATNSANWRGYIGSWEIQNDRLYLIGLRGALKAGGAGSTETFFPGFSDRVFAHWFSGRIRAPRGRLLKYVHAGYASEYEQDIMFYVDEGVIESVEIKENGKADENVANDGYQIAALTVFPHKPIADG